MVPGSRGSGSAVLAATTMLAPSAAARFAIARPMPREPPVMNRVLPLRSMSHLREVGAALFHEGREGLLGGGRGEQASEAFAFVRHLLQRRALLPLLHQPLGFDQAGDRLGGEL